MNFVERKLMELQVAMIMAAAGLKDYVNEKREGASHFVEILVMIIIVVAIGLVFKNQIIAFINNITGQATANASNLF